MSLSLLVDNSEHSQNTADAIVAEFTKANPDIQISVEVRPGGTEGDNLIKTKLATGDMNDVFMYNSGSLLQALDPAKNLTDLTGEPFISNIEDAYFPAVSANDKIYGIPFGQVMAGGMLYNMNIYSELGLSVPKTWADFMANNKKIKQAGYDPVIQTYSGDWTWTSQLFVLADFYNVTAVDPSWAEKYTANDPSAKYSVEPAFKGFQRMEDVYKAGYLNKDFASATGPQGNELLADGKGAHYPMLSSEISGVVEINPDAAKYIGFMAQPGDDASKYGLTVWSPDGLYIPTTTTGAKLDAAKRLFAWLATPEACDVISSVQAPYGPYMIKGSTLPDGLPQVVQDVQKYLNDGNVSLALEFLSPVKGPNLEKITVEVGSGITSAKDGAARYDEDVKKQAQQLGLAGW